MLVRLKTFVPDSSHTDDSARDHTSEDLPGNRCVEEGCVDERHPRTPEEFGLTIPVGYVVK